MTAGHSITPYHPIAFRHMLNLVIGAILIVKMGWTMVVLPSALRACQRLRQQHARGKVFLDIGDELSQVRVPFVKLGHPASLITAITGPSPKWVVLPRVWGRSTVIEWNQGELVVAQGELSHGMIPPAVLKG